MKVMSSQLMVWTNALMAQMNHTLCFMFLHLLLSCNSASNRYTMNWSADLIGMQGLIVKGMEDLHDDIKMYPDLDKAIQLIQRIGGMLHLHFLTLWSCFRLPQRARSMVRMQCSFCFLLG